MFKNVPWSRTSNLTWLYAGRALRSFSTAFLTVAFPLYLAQLGYSATRIGWVLTASGVVTIGLVAGVGLAGDRLGRRQAILVLAAFSAVAGAAMGTLSQFVVVVLASGLGGVGRGGGAGSGGSWGPVFPVEQPLVAASVTAEHRTRAFGNLSFIGVLAGAAGSLVAGVPALLHGQGWTWLAGYRFLFWLSGILGVGMVLVTLPIREERRRVSPDQGPSPISTRQLVGRLGVTNALNGFGFGFLGPLLTYWFYRRYHVGPAELGLLYTVVNLASAFPYLYAARLTSRLGTVRTVTLTRASAVLCLLALAVAPTFYWAGALFTLRMVFNSLGMPARQSFVMGVSDDRFRSRIAAFSMLPSQVTAMVSPVIGGTLMESLLDVPIFGGAFFMAANLVAYWFAFRHVAPPEERRAQSSGP